MAEEWIFFGVIVLVIFGAIFGIYYKNKKGKSVNYNTDNDTVLDDIINMPD